MRRECRLGSGLGLFSLLDDLLKTRRRSNFLCALRGGIFRRRSTTLTINNRTIAS